MITSGPLWGQDVCGDLWVHLQEPETVLIVFHNLVYKALTPPGILEADALVQECALATDPSVGHRKSDQCSAAQVGCQVVCP